MSLLQIVKYPDSRLYERCSPVLEFDENLKKLLDDMAQTMYEADGIGLAGPQVGKLKRAIVIDVSEERNQLWCFVNPEILESAGSESTEEGCLSIPGYREVVTRPETVKVKAFDRDGREFVLDADGLFSVCIQHEIDHLNGVLFIDRLSRLKRELFKKWYKRNGPFE